MQALQGIVGGSFFREAPNLSLCQTLITQPLYLKPREGQLPLFVGKARARLVNLFSPNVLSLVLAVELYGTQMTTVSDATA